MKKSLSIVLVLLLAMTVVGVASAQGNRPQKDRAPRQKAAVDVIRDAVNIVADSTGLEASDIVQQLRDGSTLNDVITQAGGDPAASIDAVVSSITEKINTAVEDGKLPQERADNMLENLNEIVTNAFAGELPPRQGQPNRPNPRGNRGPDPILRHLMDATVEATGLSVEDITSQLREGEGTLADIIAANGGDLQAVIDSAVAAAQVEMQERLDTRLSELPELFENAANGIRPERAPVAPDGSNQT